MQEKKSVMVVDDEPDIVRIVEIAMGIGGFDVAEACNGEQCLEKLAKGKAPDLILLDIMMPGMNGYETMQRIRAENGLPKMKIVFLTARGQKKDEEEGMKLGADGFIIKPFDPYELIDAVKGYLGPDK